MNTKKRPRETKTEYRVLRKVIEGLANDEIKSLMYPDIAKFVNLSVARIRNIFPRKEIFLLELLLELVRDVEKKVTKKKSFLHIVRTYYETKPITKAVKGMIKRVTYYYLHDTLAAVIFGISGTTNDDPNYSVKLILAADLADLFLRLSVTKLTIENLIILCNSLANAFRALFKNTRRVHYDNFDSYYYY